VRHFLSERIAAAEGRECRGVMVGHRVMHAPENRQTIHDPGGAGHVLANPQARYAGGNRAEESRISRGTEGFMSQVSRWLGPP
jgi:hypothetical protein